MLIRFVRSFANKVRAPPPLDKTRLVRPAGYSAARITPHTMQLTSPEFKALFTPQLNKLAEMFERNNYEIKIAGGAVRDLLMGLAPADVDFASTATPEEMKAMFEREEIRMLHKRGEEHGTITCRIDDAENFEITTLRVDLVCDGRRAEVQYTTDWQLDANRRDLTINSLFLGLDGSVVDFFGGCSDVRERRVRFVGDAAHRIREDYLRILRYFRFFGRISASVAHEEETLQAIRENKEGLAGISAERIWTEMKKIVVGRLAPEVVSVMVRDCGLATLLGLPEKANLDRFKSVYTAFSGRLEPMTMVAALCEKREQVDAFHHKTKLSNQERTLAEFVLEERSRAESAVRSIEKEAEGGGDEGMTYFKALIVDQDVKPGHEMFKMTGKERVIQLAMSAGAGDQLIGELLHWQVPTFDVKGTDLMRVGVAGGPKMRHVLLYLYELWKKSGFSMCSSDLLSHANDPEIPEPVNVKMSKKRKREMSSGGK